MSQLPRLRLVEMLLTASPVTIDEEHAVTIAPARNPAIGECEARRCAICGKKYPPFGVGPPLIRPGVMLWACAAHRHELDASLARRPGGIEEKIEQLSLF